jgi:hypothetical protein
LRGLKVGEPIHVYVTREEYKQIEQLEQPCDVKDLRKILQDERAETIFSASFHDQEVFVVVKNEGEDKKKPFTGQLMTCVVCNRQLQSHPEVETNWRCLEIDEELFYACDREFPADGSSAKEFEEAYNLVLACCLHDAATRKTGVATIDAIEMYRANRRLQEQRRQEKKPKGFGKEGDRQ